MNLTSYAELAVRLVNTMSPGQRESDGLDSIEAFHSLTADQPSLSDHVTPADLESLRVLRCELHLIFAAASIGQDCEAVERLNALLTRYPFHPQITRHDGQGWHVHLASSGSASDRYASGALLGLMGTVTELGADRLGVCEALGCGRAFVDGSAAGARRYCSGRCSAKTSIRPFRGLGRGRGRGQDARPASIAAS